ncbi:delta-12 fatty acid desaturas-like protein [Aspergillus niger CBS 101883]|uniref:delta-12 fatty acid desaturas-like protein n=1 Tax=Aspergillus lacticoffeatus (strain CBS 101883) TaxID=1450533 RepID=UPI000D8023F9|nr:delta-12 fatty acid desaturas-like protein [Aspergillus niger CBS 101883]PYH57164.1 delta-12 fatty acid desaturas-like protein [Aspergillus niger CBS 101883]
MESGKTGFRTVAEPHPTRLVEGGDLNQKVTVDDLRRAVPEYCFTPSLFWSCFYLFRDLVYSAILLIALYQLLQTSAVRNSSLLYYLTVNVYGVCQGIVWTGLWVIAHDCGHSAFSRWSVLNDSVGFVLHSSLLAPYFSWKSTHRRHHIYANHIEKDLNYVPPLRQSYADSIGQAVETLEDIGQDAPFVLFLRILLQQTIGWNWYILTNITCPPTAVPKKGMSMWRHSHFDPQGALFYPSEWLSIVLSDLGCFAVITGLYQLYLQFGSFETLFWVYIVPWTWVNHWIVMITYLHHTHPSVPKYTPESWSFLRGATATMDRDFGIIGTHFFHHISTDHVTHHLFSRIPHYYGPVASKAIVPLLGQHYHGRGEFTYQELKTAFSRCQWVEEDPGKDVAFGLRATETLTNRDVKNTGLWYRGGRSPLPEYKMRGSKSL